MTVDIWVKECVCVCRQWRGGEMFANVCVCVCSCKSKSESGDTCVFTCASAGGTLFHYTMRAFDIPAPPVSVHKGLSPGFDMCESAAGH